MVSNAPPHALSFLSHLSHLTPGHYSGLSQDYFWKSLTDKSRWEAWFKGKLILEKVANRLCPRCGKPELNIYYSDQTDNRVGAWCEYCNLKAYYYGEELVPINSLG